MDEVPLPVHRFTRSLKKHVRGAAMEYAVAVTALERSGEAGGVRATGGLPFLAEARAHAGDVGLKTDTVFSCTSRAIHRK